MNELTCQEAKTILQPVAHGQWLTVGRMLMPSGIHRERLGSLKELYWFLEPSSRSLPAIDFTRLSDWLENVVQDRQTAGQVRRVAQTSPSYVETCKAVYALIGTRIAEAEGVLAHDHS